MSNESMNEMIRGRAAGRRILPAYESEEARLQRAADAESREMLDKLQARESAEHEGMGSADGGARGERIREPASMNEWIRAETGRGEYTTNPDGGGGGR